MKSTYLYIFIFVFIQASLFAQPSDCVNSVVVCSSESFDFNPSGIGSVQDLNTFNEVGCLAGGESNSVWFYVEIDDMAPASQILEFLIVPDNGAQQDYDFAVYGPNVNCDVLGAPVRCSYALNSATTGLQIGAGDFSEDVDGNGLVEALTVNPGQGFFILVNNFGADGVGFQLNWGGSAADFLNCDATPPCSIVADFQYNDICKGGEDIGFSVDLESGVDDIVITWSSPSNNLDWLDDINITEPNITVPVDFVGNAIFTLSIEYIEFECSFEQSFDVNVYDYPEITDFNDESIFCSNVNIQIGPSDVYDPSTDFTWTLDGNSTGSNDQLLQTNDGGLYILTVDQFGCTTTDSLRIDRVGEPIEEFLVEDRSDICEGPSTGVLEVTSLVGGTGPYLYTFDNGFSTSDSVITGLKEGDYMITVTDVDGCTAENMVSIQEYLETSLDLGNDLNIELGDEVIINSNLNLDPSDLTANDWLYDNTIASQDPYTIQFTPLDNGELVFSVTNSNGCVFKDSIDIRVLVKEKIYIANAFSPDDNGQNDIFFIQGGNTVEKVNTLQIYNRWGEKVFENSDFFHNVREEGWDGQFKGQSLNPGSYQYYTEIELINGEIINKVGSIEIIR